MTDAAPRILLAVTVDMTLVFMRGFPEFLVERGWDVHVASTEGPLLDRLRGVAGVTVHPLRMSREPSLLRDLVSLAAWLRLIRTLRPQVVSAGTPKAGLLGSVSGALARVPRRVYHLRGLRLETSSGFARRVYTLTERIAARSATDILAVSRSLRQRAIELGIAPASKIAVLGDGSSNGVDLARFDPSLPAPTDELRASLGLTAGIPVVGFVGRLTADKGVDVLARARAMLASRGIRHQLLVIGGADGADRAQELDLGDDVVFTGRVPDPERYYRLMDVLCLPTLREGFPNVVLEAAASRVPTVTTDATGAVDSVVDGTTGLISKAGSADSLADALQSVIVDAGLRERLAGNALSHVREHFDRTRIWELTEDYYRNGGSR